MILYCLCVFVLLPLSQKAAWDRVTAGIWTFMLELVSGIVWHNSILFSLILKQVGAICALFREYALVHLSNVMNLGRGARLAAWTARFVSARWRVQIWPWTVGICYPARCIFTHFFCSALLSLHSTLAKAKSWKNNHLQIRWIITVCIFSVLIDDLHLVEYALCTQGQRSIDHSIQEK